MQRKSMNISFFRYLFWPESTYKFPRIFFIFIPWLYHAVGFFLVGPYPVSVFDVAEAMGTSVLLLAVLWIFYRSGKSKEGDGAKGNRFSSWKKVAIGILAAIVLAFLAIDLPFSRGVPSSTYNSENTLEYLNKIHGYSIQYPNTFALIDTQVFSELPKEE